MMTATTPARRHAGRPRGPDVVVEILVCGSADRGDDGAPILAAERLRERLPEDVSMRVVGQLDVLDLLDVPAGASVVVVDAATGLRRGEVVELPLNGLLEPAEIRPRSSHALAVREVIAVADMIRGHPLHGRVVAVGGGRFGLGAALSASVSRAIPDVVETVLHAADELRGASLPGASKGGQD